MNGVRSTIGAGTTLGLCSALLLSAFFSQANQYQEIVDRNLFGLKPPPSAESQAPPKPEMPKLTLTGITTILGNKRALLKTAPKPGKQGEAAKEESYILAEGQRDGDIEVISIDEKAGIVRLTYGGDPVTLSFEKDGPKGPGGPGGGPQGPPPGAPPQAPPGITRPGLRTIPTRSLRPPMPGAPALPGTSAAATPAPGGAPAADTAAAAAASQTQQTQQAQQQDLSPEELLILQDLQKDSAKDNQGTAQRPSRPGVPGAPPNFPSAPQ